MERILIWFVLSLKNYLVKRSTYLTATGMLLLVLIITTISVPSAENMSAGLVCNGSVAAEHISNQLIEKKKDFTFIKYDKEEDLINAVISGKIDCGFVFSKDFDEMCEERDTEEGISYYATTISTKGEVLKETVVSAYLEYYSRYILLDLEEEIFQNKDSKRMEKIMDNYQLYLEGNDVFQMNIEQVKLEDELKAEQDSMNPVKGLVGLTIFLIMFFAYGEAQRKDDDKVELALPLGQQIGYRFIKMLAAAVVPATVGFLLILICGHPESVFSELGSLVIFLLLNAIWISLGGKWFRKVEDLSIFLLAMIVLHLLVCPIFFDFAEYIPAIGWIRFALPLGIYFML